MKTYFENFNELVNPIIYDKRVQSMKNYIQHGNITTYEHSYEVARISYSLNKKFRIKANEKDLITAALLHDFFLYDWHNNFETNLHGFSHSTTAAENAKRYFGVNKKVYKAIRSHMWPLNITKIPLSREAWIICIADKYCALKETIFMHREKHI